MNDELFDAKAIVDRHLSIEGHQKRPPGWSSFSPDERAAIQAELDRRNTQARRAYLHFMFGPVLAELAEPRRLDYKEK